MKSNLFLFLETSWIIKSPANKNRKYGKTVCEEREKLTASGKDINKGSQKHKNAKTKHLCILSFHMIPGLVITRYKPIIAMMANG